MNYITDLLNLNEAQVSALSSVIILANIIACIWVYKDAKKRKTNAVLWAVAVILIRAPFALTAFFIARRNKHPLLCPQCKNLIESSFFFCPSCSLLLKTRCSGCGAPLNPNWKVCPKCSQAAASLQSCAYDNSVELNE